MRKTILFIILFSFDCFAQFGGVKAVEDTMRLENKFAVYKINETQTLKSSYISTENMTASSTTRLPLVDALTNCDANHDGSLVINTTNNRMYICDGTSWYIVGHDADRDGLAVGLDNDDNVAATAGNASAGQILNGKTFYTGANFTPTTGTLPTYNTTFSSDDVSIPAGNYSGGYVNVIQDGTGTANAGTGQVLSGIEFWNENGSASVGTMPTQTQGFNGSSSNQGIAAGYHSGSYINGDGDLSAGNVKSGVTIFNVTGNYTPPSTSYGKTCGGFSQCYDANWFDQTYYTAMNVQNGGTGAWPGTGYSDTARNLARTVCGYAGWGGGKWDAKDFDNNNGGVPDGQTYCTNGTTINWSGDCAMYAFQCY